MGTLRTLDMLEYAGFDAALQDHATHNMYPPVPQALPAMREAIDLMVMGLDGEPMEFVNRPDGSDVYAWEYVDAMNLEPFVEYRRQELSGGGL